MGSLPGAAEYINGTKLVNCKRCGEGRFAWAKSEKGRWYLCAAVLSARENQLDLYVKRPWEPHRCKPQAETSSPDRSTNAATRAAITVGQTCKGDFATYTVLAIAASGVTVRNVEGGYDGAYQPGSFDRMVELGHVVLLNGDRDTDGNSVGTAEVLDEFDNPCDEPSEPVTWTGPDGAVWHLTDANGPPVTAGIHEGEDYSFRITARPDVVADAHGTPFKVEMFWLLIDGETRDGRHPAYTNTPFLADGWTWTTSA